MYLIKITCKVPGKDISNSQELEYTIEVADLMVYVEGGNRMNAYATPLELTCNRFLN